jgi:hypothetical protein
MNRDDLPVSLHVVVFFVVLAAAPLLLADDSRVVFDFERDVDTWKPRVTGNTASSIC